MFLTIQRDCLKLLRSDNADKNVSEFLGSFLLDIIILDIIFVLSYFILVSKDFSQFFNLLLLLIHLLQSFILANNCWKFLRPSQSIRDYCKRHTPSVDIALIVDRCPL